MGRRGYFGVGIYGPQYECNVGTLFRSAVAFGASFIFTIGKKYKRQSSDTVNSPQVIPYYKYLTSDDFIKSVPSGCRIICVEISEKARNLINFCHPEQAIYLLGSETNGIPRRFMEDKLVVQIPTRYCLNVASAGTVIMYDRISKQGV